MGVLFDRSISQKVFSYSLTLDSSITFTVVYSLNRRFRLGDLEIKWVHAKASAYLIILGWVVVLKTVLPIHFHYLTCFTYFPQYLMEIFCNLLFSEYPQSPKIKHFRKLSSSFSITFKLARGLAMRQGCAK
jgi:hypothetical protein